MSNSEFNCTYLLPIRRIQVDPVEVGRFLRYFAQLRESGCEVLVIDGSPAEVFAAHQTAWRQLVRHFPPDPRYTFLNGKVNGVFTGLDLASCERIILADDDIRFFSPDIDHMCELLNKFELVRPQNFISPRPWWARLENARILVNRGALRAGDYPGTCGFFRSTLERLGPYDGDVLFDNEEIVRHFAINGCSIGYARDFFVLKRPPSLKKWFEQRPRQAYEDFVLRTKTAAFAAFLPLVGLLWFLFGVRAALLLLTSAASCALLLSLVGLIRDRAYWHFPLSTPFFAPLWMLERAVSVHLAFYWKLRYGGYPFGSRLLTKGTGTAWVAGGRMMRGQWVGGTAGKNKLVSHEAGKI